MDYLVNSKPFSYEALLDSRVFLKSVADAKMCLQQSAFEENRRNKFETYFRVVALSRNVELTDLRE